MLRIRVSALLVMVSMAAVGAGCSSNKQSSGSGSGVTQLSFATPDDAVTALVNAAATGDRAYARQIFGPEVDVLSSGDADVDAYERKMFVLAIQKRHELQKNADGTVDIIVGERGVEFPVPLEEHNGRWLFNTPEGVERMIDLRVGFHELKVLELLRAIPAAQAEYKSVDRDGDGVLEFAQKVQSSDGRRDGLYWPTTDKEPNSPMGPYVAEGEVPHSKSLGYQGYFFKLLTAQGAGASGGAKNYLDASGNLVGGFAVLAYPAVYGETAIMTFQMAADGVVYEKDLGAAATPTAGQTINVFDPSDGWSVTND